MRRTYDVRLVGEDGEGDKAGRVRWSLEVGGHKSKSVETGAGMSPGGALDLLLEAAAPQAGGATRRGPS